MKNHVFLVLMFLSISHIVLSQTYYYSFDSKVQLYETNKYSVQLSENLDNKLIENYNGLISINNVVVFDKINYEKFIQNEYQKIISKSKVFSTVDDLELIPFNEILLKLKDDKINNIEKFIEQNDYVIIYKKNRLILKVLNPEIDVLKLANKLFESGEYVYCYPNFISEITFFEHIPNDEYFGFQFYLLNSGQEINDGHFGTSGADIKATLAWDITRGSNNVIVAVIDQGVTPNHPDLPNARQVRLNGSNFSGNGNVNNPTPEDNDNHGNACAGIIAAEQDNNEGISGICPQCRIMPIRIFGTATSDVVADAIEFASFNGAQIISNSWGYQSNSNNLFPVIIQAIENSISNGSLVVFAAGNSANHNINNNGFVSFPANVDLDGLICIGASNRNDTQANYSPTSNLIEIVAPSHNAYPSQIAGESFEIWTIDIPGNNGYNPCNNGCDVPRFIGEELPTAGVNFLSYTGRMGGTSASCPQVAAVAALMLSLNPCLGPLEIEQMLFNSADKVGGYNYANGRSDNMGFGRLNAERALQEVLNQWILQNSTVTQNLLVAAHGHIRAGENVTNVVANNPYTVASGADVEFKATESITLEPGFTASAGSNFLAHIEAFNGDCNQWNSSKKMWVEAPNEEIYETFNNTGELLKIESIANFNPIFFPNPYNEKLYIKYDLENDESVIIQLFDLSGREIFNKVFNGHTGQNMHLIDVQTDVKMLISKTCVNGNCKTSKLVKISE